MRAGQQAPGWARRARGPFAHHAYVITTARPLAVHQLIRPPALIAIFDSHRCRAVLLDAPLWRGLHHLYALISLVAIAAAYLVAWVFATPLRLAVALAGALVLVLL
jgi:Flp pilus assembly protein TadB